MELSHTRRGVPLRTLAERGGWNLRSLYRDIEALEKAGFPVEHEEGRYRLMGGFTPPAQMGVDPEELRALHLARQHAAGFAGTRIGQALDRLYGKLATPAKGSVLPVAPGPRAAFSLAPPSAREYTSFQRTVARLDRAIRERLVVVAVYESLSGEITRRKIEPAQLHWDPRLETLYVLGWCRRRQDLRVFAAHRFREVRISREHFESRPGASSEQAMRHAFRVWRADAVRRVRLRFVNRGARLIIDRRWHPSQRTSRHPDGAVLFEADLAGLDEITPWILSFGADCTVLEPDELRERVRRAHHGGVLANGGRPPRL